MAEVVLGIFSERDQADKAVDDLRNLGYDSKDISIITKSHDGIRQRPDYGGEVVSGAATGVIVGGVAGLLIGIGAITIPGIGPLLIGGPVATALGLTGAAATTLSGAVTGALAGGLIGALMGLGLSREEAQFYEERIKKGGILIVVPVFEERGNEAREVLEEYGADQIRTIVLPETGRRIHSSPPKAM